MDEFLLELGANIDKYKTVIMTGVGYLGGGTGVLTATTLYLKSKFKKAEEVSKTEIDLLKQEISELKEGNQIMINYVQLSSELKAKSSVVDETARNKFAEMSNMANTYKETFLSKIKDKAQEIISKF